MAKEETTPEERRQYILEQRVANESPTKFPRDMSFIVGNIIRPNKEDYEAHKKKLKQPDDYDSQSRYNLLIIAVIGLFVGILFLSSNLTGFAISNLTNKTSSMIGTGFFILGIVGSYFYLQNFERKLHLLRCR